MPRKFPNYPKPEVDQVWVSADPRDASLQMRRRVLAVEGDKVTLDGFVKTKVSVERMRPVSNGYRLVRTADGKPYTYNEESRP